MLSAENEYPTRFTGVATHPGLLEALAAMELAQNRLDYAETDAMVDAAVYELQAAELQLKAVVVRAKSS